MSFLAFFLLIGIASSAQVETTTAPAAITSIDEEIFKADIESRGRFNYNIYYTSDREVSDFSALISPKIITQSKPKFFQISAKLSGEYEKFFSQAIQDHFDYSLKTHTTINEGGTYSFALNLDYFQFSDPSFNSTSGRPNHQKIKVDSFLLIKRDDGNQIKIAIKGKYEDISIPNYNYNKNYLTHYDAEFLGEYDFKFLPETFWFLRASGGTRQYVTPTMSPESISLYVPGFGVSSLKTSSYFGMGEVGISGRLTDKTSIDAATGFMARIYSFGDSFVAPVFYLHFIEQITRRDQLIAGYNYVVEDSYSTNYLLNQEIYLGLARMMGDQVLMLVRLSYEYKNYSTPVSRNDERITGGGTLKYSFKPNLKFFAEIKVDLMATDFYDNNLNTTNPDKPGSYRAGYLGLGAMATF